MPFMGLRGVYVKCARQQYLSKMIKNKYEVYAQRVLSLFIMSGA